MLRDILKKDNTRIFPSKENLENHIVLSIKKYIEKNLQSKITLEDICNEFSYGKSYLCKLFKDSTGFPIITYVNNIKIDYAKKLIRDNNYNITEISDILSFDNPQYFSRVFKKITNMTPSEFKLSLKYNY